MVKLVWMLTAAPKRTRIRIALVCPLCISSINDANAFMPRFIEAYNARFAKPAREKYDAHRKLRAEEDLDSVFSWRELRASAPGI